MGAVVAHPSQPAVMVASTTHAAVTHVVHTSVVETTAAQPETETRDTEEVVASWATVLAVLEGVSLSFIFSPTRGREVMARRTYMARKAARAIKTRCMVVGSTQGQNEFSGRLSRPQRLAEVIARK